MAYEITDPVVFPAVPTRTVAQKSHARPVSGSICVGSETRNPAKGRMSSDGRGTIALSMVMATKTPAYPTVP